MEDCAQTSGDFSFLAPPLFFSAMRYKASPLERLGAKKVMQPGVLENKSPCIFPPSGGMESRNLMMQASLYRGCRGGISKGLSHCRKGPFSFLFFSFLECRY
jgi:hypothetical protein